MKYICDRCDIQAETALGHHLCAAPTDGEVNAAVARGLDYVDVLLDEEECPWVRSREMAATKQSHFRIRYPWAWNLAHAIADLEPILQSRGYRWSLSSVGDGTEYRATFEHGLGNTVASALDTTPARAFARGFLRLPKESEG